MILSPSSNLTKTRIKSDTDLETASSTFPVLFCLITAEQARDLVESDKTKVEKELKAKKE